MFCVKMPYACIVKRKASCTWESPSPKISHPALKSVKRQSLCQPSETYSFHDVYPKSD